MELMKSSFSEISSSRNLINSFPFHKWNKELKDHPLFLQQRLSDYFDVLSGYAFKSEDYELNGIKLLRIGDINKDGSISWHDMNSLPADYQESYKRFLIQENDIAIAMTGATIGKTGFFYEIKEPLLLNQRVGILRPKTTVEFYPKLVYYLLKDKRFLKQIFINSMGKSQPNISPFDILNCRIPNIDTESQRLILEKINPIDLNIKELIKDTKKDKDIINLVFAEELNLDIEKFETLKSENKFNSTLKEFGNNIDCRFSFKFHNRAGQFVWDFLCSKTDKRIKDFIAEPIVLGKSVSPKDYDDDGNYYYIAMSNIKTWAFEPEGCKTVSNEYSEANMNKSVKKNDIILARSGEGTIGKIALIEDEDIKAIHADFTQRIRLKNYSPRLAYYYMRSELFQYLVYTHKKGLGNNTNIFPSQIQEFPIPDWDEEKQKEIVDKIKTQIDSQKEIDKQIAEKQAEISAIIEKAIQTE